MRAPWRATRRARASRRRLRLGLAGAADARIAAAPARAALRARLDAAGVEVGGGAHRELARLVQRRLERAGVDDVGPRVGAGHVVADEPARGQLAPRQWLVEAGDGLEPEQVAHREQVERDLQLQLVGPLHAADDAAALVVAHDRGAAGADVDAVDAAGDGPAVAAQRERPVRVAGAAERPLELGRLVARAALGLG